MLPIPIKEFEITEEEIQAVIKIETKKKTEK
jgi:hypothetical protein